MKTLRISLCALLAACVFSLAGVSRSSADFDFTIAKPDLTITQIAENGTQAWVLVKNIGTGNSAACYLRVWHLSNGVWYITTTKAVGGIAPGQSVWVSVTGAGIAAAFNYYKIDATNLVNESKESNNGVYIPYGPVG